MTRPPLHADPLTGRLPASTPAQAALSRLAFDTRFADWLRGTLGQPALAVAPPPSGARWLLTVDTAHGPFRAAVDADNDG